MDTAGTWILLVEGKESDTIWTIQKKKKVSDTIWHGALPILKYPVSIAYSSAGTFYFMKTS